MEKSEKSEQLNYNESNNPTINVNQQGNFVHPPSYQPFDNSGFQNDFNQRPNYGPPPIHQQPINTFPTFVPQQPVPRESYCGRLSRNARQTASVSGGLLLMMASGLHIGWGIWRNIFMGIWPIESTIGLQIFVIMAWSVGAFLGGFVGSILTQLLRKNFIYFLSGGIMIAGNLLIIIWDEYGEAIATGRILLGIAHGLAFVTLIIHAGENAAKNMRGTVLSVVNCMLYTGIFVSVVITGAVRYTWWGYPETISSDRIVAIVGVMLAVGAIGCALMWTVETVPFLLDRNSHDHAKINLKHLRGLSHETLALTQEMEEFHLMHVQDKQDSWNIFTNGNVKPLLLMILMRIMVALTNNFLFNTVCISFVGQMFNTFNRDDYRLAALAVVAPRLAMAIFQIFYADVFKRKLQFGLSSLFAAGTLIIIGIVANTVSVYSFHQLRVVNVAIAIMWLFFQLTCSMGMDQMQDVYLSEAFSTAKKHWSIAIVAGFEHLFHIFMIGMYFVGVTATAHINAIIFVTAVVVGLFAIILVLAVPETQNMSLKQAKDSFINYSMRMASPFS